MIDRPLRVRFAPSPTGTLHLGNARTALFNWLTARRSGGTFVLRIEDTDTAREREGSEAGILADLRWLGLTWDEGPDVGGPLGPYRQSERDRLYRDAADRLLASGAAYRCFCSDEQIDADREAAKAAGDVPRYSGRCGTLTAAESEARVAAGESFAVRFRTLEPGIPADAQNARFRDLLRGPVLYPLKELGDGVLVRRDGRPTYNFAVVLDDATMEIDLVLRGDDHISNTPRQVLLYQALGYRVPVFAHLPMVRGADGERLSKRHGAVSVAEYRDRGFPPEGVANALVLLGWAPRDEQYVMTLDDMVREFDPEQVSRSASTFDSDRLAWLSGEHVRRLPLERLAREVGQRLQGAGLIPADAVATAPTWIAGVAELLRNHVHAGEQVAACAAPLFARGGGGDDEEARAVLAEDGATAVVAALDEAIRDAPPEDQAAWKAIVGQVKSATGCKGKALFRPIRVAVTGRASGPDLNSMVPLIVDGHRRFEDAVPSLAERVRRTREAAG